MNCHRREKLGKALRKRLPFLGLAGLAGHRCWKWRRWLAVLRPKYLVMSLLFVGWTGGFRGDHHRPDDDDQPLG